MVDYLTKPVDEQRLRLTIARWLSQRIVDSDALLPEPSVVIASNMPVLPGVDVQAAISRLCGDSELYYWFLEKFAESYGNAGSRLEELIRQQDFSAAERLAHSLKGDAGTVGSITLWDVAESLELALRQHEIDEEVQKQLQELVLELNRLVACITSLTKNDKI